jgi:hypothetical protein
MTKEELLKERYKVISDYPGCVFRLGEILEATEFPQRWAAEKFNLNNNHPAYYPNIFKKLEWWEERKKEEMPIYIKSLSDGRVAKSEKWDIKKNQLSDENTYAVVGRFCWFVRGISPATEEEYNSQFNKATS